MSRGLRWWFLVAWLVFVFWLGGRFAGAQDAILATQSAPAEAVTVGEPIPLTVEVEHPVGFRVLPPAFADAMWGDFEVRDISAVQVAPVSAEVERSTFILSLALWAPGGYQTPLLALEVVDEQGDLSQVVAPHASVEVTSVLVAEDTTLRDIRPQATIFFEHARVWIALGALCVLVVFLLLLSLVRRWLLARRHQIEEAIVEVDNRPAHVVALESLNKVDLQGLPALEQYKMHYTLVSDVLRQYLQDGHGVASLEQTTGEIKDNLQKSSLEIAAQIGFAELLELADLVKFTDMIPGDAMTHNLIPQARRLVISTKPDTEKLLAEPSVNGKLKGEAAA